jgi:hypothetical protein
MEPTEQEKIKKIDQLISAIDKTYHNPGRLAWRGFLIGLASGLGTTLGVAIVLSIIGLLVRAFGGLPVIGEWITNFGAIVPKR